MQYKSLEECERNVGQSDIWSCKIGEDLNWTLKIVQELPDQRRKKRKAYFRQMKQYAFEEKDIIIVKQ